MDAAATYVCDGLVRARSPSRSSRIVVIATLNPSFLSPLNIQVLLLGDRRQHADRLLADDHHRHRPDEPVGRRDRRPRGDQLRRADAGLGPAGAARGRRRRSRSGFAAGIVNGALHRLDRHLGLRHHAGDACRSSRASTSRITKAQPFYGVPESVKAFGNTTLLGPLPWLIVPTVIVVAADVVPPQPPAARPLHPGRRRQSACGRAVRHLGADAR